MPYNDLRKGRYSEAGRIYLITAVLSERRPLFQDFYLARLVVAEMRRLDESAEVDSLAWVVMPDHVHWLLSLGEYANLSVVVKSLKARSAMAINRALGVEGSVWQRAFHDHALRRDEDILTLARYVISNPLRAGLVNSVGDYPHWDCKWL